MGAKATPAIRSCHGKKYQSIRLFSKPLPRSRVTEFRDRTCTRGSHMRILVPVDGSARANRALAHALLLADGLRRRRPAFADKAGNAHPDAGKRAHPGDAGSDSWRVDYLGNVSATSSR